MPAGFSECGLRVKKSPNLRSSVCMHCSIADRNPLESPSATDRTSSSIKTWAWCHRSSPKRAWNHCTDTSRSVTRATPLRVRACGRTPSRRSVRQRRATWPSGTTETSPTRQTCPSGWRNWPAHQVNCRSTPVCMRPPIRKSFPVFSRLTPICHSNRRHSRNFRSFSVRSHWSSWTTTPCTPPVMPKGYVPSSWDASSVDG